MKMTEEESARLSALREKEKEGTISSKEIEELKALSRKIIKTMYMGAPYPEQSDS